MHRDDMIKIIKPAKVRTEGEINKKQIQVPTQVEQRHEIAVDAVRQKICRQTKAKETDDVDDDAAEKTFERRYTVKVGQNLDGQVSRFWPKLKFNHLALSGHIEVGLQRNIQLSNFRQRKLDILISRLLIGPAHLPLLTLVVMLPATIKQALALNVRPVH